MLEQLRHLFVKNIYLKAVAVILTLTLYVWVGVDREVSKRVNVPVRIQVPSHLVLIEKSISQVNITIRGRWSEVHRVDPKDLNPITVEVTEDDEDGVIPLSSDLVEAPRGVRVISVRPNSIRIDLAHRQAKTVPINPDIRGQPPRGYKLQEVSLTPTKLKISGPPENLESVETLPTEPIDITGRNENFKKLVRVRLPDPVLSYVNRETVEMSVVIDSERSRKRLTEIPVHAVNTTRATEIYPKTVSMTLVGTRQVLDDLNKSSIQAFLNLKTEQNKAPGIFEKEVQIRNLPGEIDVRDINPKHFRVQIFEEPINTDSGNQQEQQQAVE